MSFDPSDYFIPEAIEIIKYHIRNNEGNEVLFVGSVNDDGVVCDVRAVAMGHETAVVNVSSVARPGDICIHNHPSGNIKPSNPDLALASQGAEYGVGSYIVDNDVTKILPVVKWIPSEETGVEKISESDVDEIFGHEGVISSFFKGFEFRKPQLLMAKKIAEAVNNKKLLAVEAGTGTGKSFAYLVPLMLYIISNKGKKAVVSTSTIALEEQLKEKDIPVLQSLLDCEDLPVAILKGRSNYICKRRYENYRSGSMLLPFGEGENREKIVHSLDQWIELPHDGSRTSLNADVDIKVWREICCDETSCERGRCRYFEECFFFKARRKVNFASLILVNHHLLMADISIKMDNDGERGLLPAYDILVMDEAHNVFKSAVSFLGETVSVYAVRFTLMRIFNREKNSGLLSGLYDIAPSLSRDFTNFIEELMNSISVLNASMKHLYLPEIQDFFKQNFEDSGNTFELDEISFRKELGEKIKKMMISLENLSTDLEKLIVRFKDHVVEDPWERSKKDDFIYSLFTDIKGASIKIETVYRFFKRFLSDEDIGDSVFWAEKKGRKNFAFTITPVAIQKILSEHLYEKTDSVIFSSASLATSRERSSGFDFFARESGISACEREKEFVMLPGCFNFSEQLKAFAISDLPLPNTKNFDEASIKISRELIRASGGSALLLFTSIKHREQAYTELRNMELPVLNQGFGSIGMIVDDFRTNITSSLLATDTFWEGMDMKGDTLRNLIIIRLPFRFPGHPFVKRYIRKLEEETGKSGFMLYTLPNAVLKMKQGVGRLIRSGKDIGTITILDKRIVTKRYGKQFMDALPADVNFNILNGSSAVVKTTDFFKKSKCSSE
ncbi:MAG: helicase C-terminal domain-containing protein [bacterium]